MGNITIIGMGNMARTLGTLAAVGDNTVEIVGRDHSKADVKAFIKSLGLRPRDVGGLKMARWLEGMGLVTVGLAGNGVGPGDFALGVNEFSG
jgi:hypothetical protein